MSSVGGISFGGLASGLDTKSIIAQLLAIEQRPISLLQAKKSSFQTKKSLYGDLETKLDKLFDTAKGLRLSSSFLEFNVKTSDDDKFLKASASSTATAGKYDVEILQLAQARTRTTLGSVDSDTTRHGSGLLRFDFADAPSVFVNVPDSVEEPSSLDNIAAAINDADSGLQASVVNTGIGNSPYKLVVKSTETGEENDFTVSTDTANAALQSLADELTADNAIAALDSRAKIDGIEVQRSSNTLSDLIDGVTIDLGAVHTATEKKTTITVTPDTEETGEKVKAFVDAYNEVLDFIAEQQKLITSGDSSSEDDDEEVKANPLFGESALRTIRSTLRNIVGGSVDGNEAYALFSQIGIESDRDGKLTFNKSEFDAAVTKDPTAVRNIFAADDIGIANKIYTTIDQWTDSIDGLLATRKQGIDRTVKDINSQIERAEEKMDRYQVFLTQKYANLEVTLGRLNSQLGSLANIGQQQ